MEDIIKPVDVKITLTYIGRNNVDSDNHYYIIEKTNQRFCFKRKITKFDTIGNQIECLFNGDVTIKPPYVTLLEKSNNPDLKEWTAIDLARFQKKRIEKYSKEIPKNSIQNNIDIIVKECKYLSKEQRKLIAFNIIDQIIN